MSTVYTSFRIASCTLLCVIVQADCFGLLRGTDHNARAGEEKLKTILSVTNWQKGSEPREPRFRNAKPTPRIKVLLEKLRVTQLVKTFSAF